VEWCSDVPQDVGAYWVVTQLPEKQPDLQIVSVEYSQGALSFWMWGTEERFYMDSEYVICWMGPLSAPESPGG